MSQHCFLLGGRVHIAAYIFPSFEGDSSGAQAFAGANTVQTWLIGGLALPDRHRSLKLQGKAGSPPSLH